MFPAANKSRIVAEGGLGALMAAMRRHCLDALVQQHALAVLQNLAGGHCAFFWLIESDVCSPSLPRAVENKQRLGAEGGVQLVVAAMHNHPRDLAVLRYAASALKNFCSDVGTYASPAVSHPLTLPPPDANRLLVTREGGVEALLRALAAYPGENDLVTVIAAALQNIAANNGELPPALSSAHRLITSHRIHAG